MSSLVSRPGLCFLLLPVLFNPLPCSGFTLFGSQSYRLLEVRREQADGRRSLALFLQSKNKNNRSTRKPNAERGRSSRQSKSQPRLRRPSLSEQLDYHRDGHCVLRGLLEKQQKDLTSLRKELQAYAQSKTLEAWRQKVEVASDATTARACCTVAACRKQLQQLGIADEVPFLQYFHTWRDVDVSLALAQQLAPVAATLLDVPQVRLYQDSLFHKRPGDGPTPWHADARMAPLDTSLMLTFWIPLHDVTSTGLIFCSKTHNDFALPYWHDDWGDVAERYPKQEVSYMPLSLGDVTVHAGWTLHCADGNLSKKDRYALAITYCDAMAPVRDAAGDDEDAWSYQDWITQVSKGTRRWNHPKVPILRSKY